MTLHGVLIGLAIALGIWLALVAALFALGRASVARELVGLIPNLLVLFRGLVKDPRVPRGAKVWLALGAVWIASPIDLLPEFLPVIGPLDDAIVAAAVLRHLLRKAGPEVIEQHWTGSPEMLERLLRVAGNRPGGVGTSRPSEPGP